MKVPTPFLAMAACSAILLTSCSQESAQKTRTYQMGERIQSGPFIYTAFEGQWMTQLGSGAAARLPQHRFFLVRLSITNAGSTDAITPPVGLVNAKGESVEELADGEGVPNWIGSLRQIKPANSAQGNVVFDVPPGHYKLRIVDESEKNIALVDIPLSFDSGAPAIAVPGGDKNPAPEAIKSPGKR